MYPLAFSLCCLRTALSHKLAIGIVAVTPLPLISAHKCVFIFYIQKAVVLEIFLDTKSDCRSDQIKCILH